jgi:hypothetical protein
MKSIPTALLVGAGVLLATSVFANRINAPSDKALAAGEAVRLDWHRRFEALAKVTANEQCLAAKEIESRGLKPGIPSRLVCDGFQGERIAKMIDGPRLLDLNLPQGAWLAETGGVCVEAGFMIRAYATLGDGEGRLRGQAMSTSAKILSIGKVERDARCEAAVTGSR